MRTNDIKFYKSSNNELNIVMSMNNVMKREKCAITRAGGVL